MEKSISLCMIVKNEETVLHRCIDSIRPLCDEIVIVDTGSTDQTVAAARKRTDAVYFFPWCDDFSAARNFAFSKATKTHRMWLDADDVVPSDSLQKLLEWKSKSCTENEVVYLPYETSFDENGNATFVFDRERIVPSALPHTWKGRVHEVLVHRGTVIRIDSPIRHASIKTGYSNRNLNIYERMKAEGHSFEPRDRFYYGRELFYHRRYDAAIAVLEPYLESEEGWCCDRVEAVKVLSECYRGISDAEREKSILLHSFAYAEPRADVCCMLGRWHMERGLWTEAIFWYQTALQCGICRKERGFRDLNAEAYVPYLQLCVLYDRIGRTEEAEMWNRLAASVRPNSEAVQHNQAYFREKRHTSSLESE